LDVLTFSTLEGPAARCKLRFSPDRPGELQMPANRTFPPYVSVTSLALQAAAPHKAELIERQYPFEDYGEGMWGAIYNFNRAKANTLKLGYCWRQSEERFSAAFIMPDGYVLGFGGEGIAESEGIRRHKAALAFRRKVWPN
jgi:DNA-binding IclR family transcriptional regulator